MGIVNATPDSFSDGGRFLDPAAAVAHGMALVAEGADVVDVGGESTRPGAVEVDVEEERRRVVPVVTALAAHVRVSVDTRKAAVAEAAVEAGATLVNDVSASLFEVAAAGGVGWIAMHMQGQPATMQDRSPLRRRGGGGAHAPGRAGRPGGRRPASVRSGSTRGSGSARTTATTSSCSPGSTSSWRRGCRSWSARAGRASSGA
jgi:hypothetical protein